MDELRIRMRLETTDEDKTRDGDGHDGTNDKSNIILKK